MKQKCSDPSRERSYVVHKSDPFRDRSDVVCKCDGPKVGRFFWRILNPLIVLVLVVVLDP
jgi:hypothetical protein